jgi:Spy/CpxP family protein refolding chaperone
VKLKKIALETGLALVLVLSFGSVMTFAQETKPEQTEATPKSKIEKRQKRLLGREGRRGFHKHFGKMGLRHLNLTDAQREQMKTVRQEFREKFGPQHQELRALAQKKRDGAFTADDEARLKALREQMKTSHQELRSRMEGILTDEQRQQLQQQKEQMKQRREEMRKRRQEKPD